MKTPKFLSLIAVLGYLIAFTSCDNAAQKVEKAEENVVDAEKDLRMAEEEYRADIAEYRILAAEKIAANDKIIADFNIRINNERKNLNADYIRKFKALEQKNSDMKRKMDEYKENGKENWDSFKSEFAKDMDELGSSIENFGKDQK